MSKIKAIVTFAVGFVIGGAVAWNYAEKKYADLADSEIDSVKRAYANYIRKEPETPVAEVTEEPEKERPPEYVKVVPSEPIQRDVEAPYVISPEEFNELDGYTSISLLYFADGVLSDEYGVIIDDVDEIVGDGLEHFGEYEEDSVYVRSDTKRCDYEILMDLRTYEEFRKTLPTNI